MQFLKLPYIPRTVLQQLLPGLSILLRLQLRQLILNSFEPLDSRSTAAPELSVAAVTWSLSAQRVPASSH